MKWLQWALPLAGGGIDGGLANRLSDRGAVHKAARP
jgi:hypothetical protein